MQSLYEGDFVYFIKHGEEYLGEVIGINADKVITVRYKDRNSKIMIQPIGAFYDVHLTDIVGIKQLNAEHKNKEKHADYEENGGWKFIT